MAQTRVRRQSRDAAAAADASSTTNSEHSKRKRDVLRDISEEHSCKGVSTRQQQQQQASSASSSHRSQEAPRRPSPMAPARRASVRIRRSRRVNEQPPSTTVPSGSGVRSGQRRSRSAAAAAAAVATAAGAVTEGSAGCATATTLSDGAGGRSASVRYEEEEEEEGDEEDGSMSCDEDLEGMVVDLSFEGVADERDEETSNKQQQHRRRASQQQAAAASSDIKSEGNAAEERGKGARSRRSGGREVAASGDQATSSDEPDQEQHSTHPCLTARSSSSSSSSPSAAGQNNSRAYSGTAAASASSASAGCGLLPPGVRDIDASVQEEGESHLLNPEYVKEHAAFLREQEKRNRPTAYIGVKQKDMRPSMRSVLVDWICEVCDLFKLSTRTLFQAVDLIDRSLSVFDVPRGKLQLLGCACVVLASKYEEIYATTAEELAHISDNTYTRAEIIAMELVVVNALQFRLSCITPCNFQERFCRAAGSNARERSLVAYLMELLLQDYQGVTLLPSLKAASALYLARQTLHPRGCPREAWSGQTEHYTGYCARELEPCVRRLHSLHVRAEASNLHAVRDKYKKSAMHRVADVTCALEDSLHFGDDDGDD